MLSAPLLFALLAIAAPASEDDDVPPVQDYAAYAVAGLGTPVGGLGFEWVSRFTPRFELAAGFGAGLGAAGSDSHPNLRETLQWSLMPRFLFGGPRVNMTVGAGISGGNYAPFTFCFDDCSPNPVRYFLWANAEVGLEGWSESGFAARVFAGWGHGWCVAAACQDRTSDIPYVGAGIGYAF